MRGGTFSVATMVILLTSAPAAMANDLEVTVHDGSAAGAGVAHLDLLLCKDGPCTAVATTDGKGRVVFEGVDAGDVSIRALTIGCGPFEWPVKVRSSAELQKVDVVIPATGRLTLRVGRLDKEGKTLPVAGTRLEVLVKTQDDLPGLHRLSATGTETDAKGFARLCLPAGLALELTVKADGFQAGTLLPQRLEAGASANAEIVLRTR